MDDDRPVGFSGCLAAWLPGINRIETSEDGSIAASWLDPTQPFIYLGAGSVILLDWVSFLFALALQWFHLVVGRSLQSRRLPAPPTAAVLAPVCVTETENELVNNPLESRERAMPSTNDCWCLISNSFTQFTAGTTEMISFSHLTPTH